MNEADFERVIAETGQEDAFDAYAHSLVEARLSFCQRFEPLISAVDEDDYERHRELEAEMDAEIAKLNAACPYIGEDVNVFGAGCERYFDYDENQLSTRDRLFDGDTVMMVGFTYIIEFDEQHQSRVRLGYKFSEEGQRLQLSARGPLQQEQIALFSFAEIGAVTVNDRFFGAREISDLRYKYPELVEQLDRLIDSSASEDEKILTLKHHVIPVDFNMTPHERGILASYVHTRIDIDIELPYAMAASGPIVFEDSENDMQWMGEDETLKQEMRIDFMSSDKPFVAQPTSLMIARKPEVNDRGDIVLSKDYHWHLAVDAYGGERNTGSQEVLLPISSVVGLSSIRELTLDARTDVE